MARHHKLHCWEFMNCGMEPGGIFAATYGPCPAAVSILEEEASHDEKIRSCWEIMPDNTKNITYTCRFSRKSCHDCLYYQRINIERQTREFEETISGI